MKNIILPLLVIGCALTHTGCVSVEDTSGIKKYFEEQGRAEIHAVRLKALTKPTDAKYTEASNAYNEAAGISNGWTRGVAADVRLKKVVKVSLQDFESSNAGKAIAKFRAIELPPTTQTIEPVTIALILQAAEGITKIVIDQNHKMVEKAATTIEQEFKKAEWTTFELTTSDWLSKKYGANK